MRKIGPKNSSQEIIVRNLIKSLGQKFSLHQKNLPGSPDLVFLRRKKVIFIHGCFWHSHRNCKKALLPSTNKDFWEKKIQSNILRDQRAYRQLNRNGWSYMCVWQCKLNKDGLEKVRNRIRKFLQI